MSSCRSSSCTSPCELVRNCNGIACFNTINIMVATGQGKVREIQGQGKVREFCAGSGKFEILRKVRQIQENPLKVGEI